MSALAERIWTSASSVFGLFRANMASGSDRDTSANGGGRAGALEEHHISDLDVPHDDVALVQRIREGDERAFTALVNRCAAPLYAYARSFLNTPETAQDLVQDVFADLWEQRARLAPAGSIERHLFGAARFRALHILRRDRLEKRHLPAEHEHRAFPTADIELERADLYAAAVRIARNLPRRTAAVFALRWGEGLSYAAIATRLGISVKGVEVQMTRAFRAIRDQLEPPKK